jgi:4-carboxymuconolactone decarboxylase
MGSRLPPLTEDQLDDEQRQLWTTVTGQSRVVPAVNDSGNLVGPYDILLRSPRVGVLFAELGSGLRRTTGLSARLLELIILAVAEHWHCDFEWLVHTEMARQLGLAEETISAIRAGRVPGFDDHREKAVYRVVTQLLRTGSVDDEAFALVRELFGDDGAVELIVFTGHYTVIAFILNSFAVALPGAAPTFGHGAGQLHALQVDRREDDLIRRLAALHEDELTDAQRMLWDAIHATPRPLPPTDDQGHLLGPYDVLLRSPRIGKLLGAFGTGLRAVTDVPKRLQEVIVLVAVAYWRCEMLWAAHEPQARAAGIGDDVIKAIREGANPHFGPDADLRALYRLASELLRTGRLAPATFDECRELLGDKALVELVLLAGHYCTQCFLLNAAQVPPMHNAQAVWAN